MATRSGCLISLDGLDGSGKSTQCRLLAEHFRSRGEPVVLCRDPGTTELGNQLRNILLHHTGDICPASEAGLFMAARAQMIAEVVEPALGRNETVICDRFLLATLAYQGYGSGLQVEGLRQAAYFSARSILPDLALVLDLPVEAARRRLGADTDRLERRTPEYHQRVREGFLAEANLDMGRIRVIDANRAPNEVFQSVLHAIGEWESTRAVG